MRVILYTDITQLFVRMYILKLNKMTEHETRHNDA